MPLQRYMTDLSVPEPMVTIDHLAINDEEVDGIASKHVWSGDILDGQITISPKLDTSVHLEIRFKGD